MSSPCVVDTNVVLVANKLSSDASAGCIQNCARRLSEICNKGHLVLDDLGRIFTEYRNKTLVRKGQREAGDEFILWVITNQWNPQKCSRVPLTPKEDDQDFEEFPDHPALADFDRSDRVFVATANAHPDKPPILSACDTDYWKCREAFEQCNISVEFLCEADVSGLAARKQNV